MYGGHRTEPWEHVFASTPRSPPNSFHALQPAPRVSGALELTRCGLSAGGASHEALFARERLARCGGDLHLGQLTGSGEA
jgi:hypothetical protein